MPTSASKSLLFMLPAFAEPGGLTVVVVPLKSLCAGIRRRCDEMGIRYVVWDPRWPADAASIVLVTPERAVSDESGTFLNRIKMRGRLDRVVIDECHVMFNKGLGFRKPLQRIGELMVAEALIVLFSATVTTI
jgi:superfamily II DNA helicase RecQ